MGNPAEYNGRLLKEIFSAATSWLEKATPQIDALNVFPVPDGDTGTNMLLTMRSAERESLSAGEGAGEVLQAMARGALMGARGNSGVILAQIFQGLSHALQGKATFSAKDLAFAFKQASASAYKGVSRPVEGTMLTVIRELAGALNNPNRIFHDLASLMEEAVERARETVAKTPSLLPVLAQAGVVDAGGQGLYTILEGILLYLKRGLKIEKPQIIQPLTQPERLKAITEEKGYGYCTEFILSKTRIKTEKIAHQLEKLGGSVMVAGNREALKIHIHTPDPRKVLRQAIKCGNLHNILIRNMSEQIKESRAEDIALVAVANGVGFIEIFLNLGASAVISGGEKMNPSIGELLQVVNSILAGKIIVLPNNKNIIPAAEKLKEISGKGVFVIPSTSLPQGVAAALSFNPETPISDNLRLMEKALSSVKTLSITKAVRGAKWGGLKIRKGQFIGMLDRELIDAHDKITPLILKILGKLDLKGINMITIYYGKGVSPRQAEEIAQVLRGKTSAEVEVVFGGQPLYHYLISLE